MFLFSFTSISSDENFIVLEEDGFFFIKESKSKNFISVNTFNNQRPKIKTVVKNKKFRLIYFEGGAAGTSTQINHEMVAIFDSEKKEFHEKTYITKFIGLGPEAQPKLEIKENKIIYSLPKN